MKFITIIWIYYVKVLYVLYFMQSEENKHSCLDFFCTILFHFYTVEDKGIRKVLLPKMETFIHRKLLLNIRIVIITYVTFRYLRIISLLLGLQKNIYYIRLLRQTIKLTYKMLCFLSLKARRKQI